MSDTVKIIIEIPKELLKGIINRNPELETEYVCDQLVYSIDKSKPLSEVVADVKEKCDRIDDIARANIYQYAPHREIQDLLCEILASIGNTESEGK